MPGIYKNSLTIYCVPVIVLCPDNKKTLCNILETPEKHI